MLDPSTVADMKDLEPGSIIDNRRLMELFGVGVMGGMRRNVERNHLVVVSDHTKSLYEDRWEGNILHYTGMGKRGHQTLTAQNRTVNDSRDTGVKIYLFEVFKPGQYIFHGETVLDALPYTEIQPDIEQTPRRVWMFPLRLLAKDYSPLPSQADFDRIRRLRERALRKLSIGQLRTLAEGAPDQPPRRRTAATILVRSEAVAAYVKKAAEGRCDLCGLPAPFIGRDRVPYLECHHIEYLSAGGPDTIANAVALCPNCHRKMHALNQSQDRLILLKRVHARDRVECS